VSGKGKNNNNLVAMITIMAASNIVLIGLLGWIGIPISIALSFLVFKKRRVQSIATDRICNWSDNNHNRLGRTVAGYYEQYVAQISFQTTGRITCACSEILR
jgi:hypothetical protein